MSIMCVYQGCLSVKNPCGRIAFFRLPTDDRRDTWIRNSGNKSLLKIGKNSNRFFCEKHFRECDIASQFNRKLLRRHAVPIEHASLISTAEPKVFEEEEESNESTMESFAKQESINFAIEAIDESNVNTSSVYSDSPVLELINASNDKEELDVPYSLIELYDEPSHDEKIVEVEPAVDSSERETKLQDETLEIYFEDTCTSQVDSSEVEHDITIPEQNGTTYLHKDIEIVTKNPTKKRPNETKTTFPPSQRVKEDVTVLENSYEEDKHFALSLVGYFQRLPQSKKAMAKLKILQYLTELEIMD